MIVRHVDDRDLVACLETHAGHIGTGLIGRDRAIHVWKSLIRSSAVGSALVEAEPAIRGHRIVGFGAGVFVSRTFAENEISNPQPGLNDRIIAGIDSGQTVSLDEAGIRSANAKGGLDLMILYASVREGLTSEQMSEVHRLLAGAFSEHHAGYRLNQMLTEVIGELEQHYFKATHVWRVIARFDESGFRQDAEWGPGCVVALAGRKEALAVTGSMASNVFQYREPILRLRDVDRQLLTAALDNQTDEELSEKLHLSLWAVKKRWASTFARVSDVKPDLFLSLNEDTNDRQRGRQKRHRLLAYVRAHPEELRPIHPRWLR